LEGTDVMSYTWIFAASYLGLKLVEWAFHGPARVMERKLAFNLSKNFLDELYHQILHLPVKWHKDHHSGATINKIQKAYGSLKEFFQNGFVYVQVLGKFIFSLGAMCFFSPLFGFIGVLIGMFTVWVIFQFDKRFVTYLKQCNEREHEVSSNLFDSLSNIITVITLRLENSMQSSLFEKIANVFPPFKKQITINEWKWFIASMLVACVYVIVVIGYVYQNYTPGQTFLIGGLVTLLAYVTQFTSVFYDVAAHYTRIVQFNTDVHAATALSEIYLQNHRPEAAANMPATWKAIDLKNIHFSHGPFHKSNISGLHDLQIRINRGERIALIGESGSGKSTLLALLRGLYAPEPGSILKIDEKSDCDFGMIANNVTLFPQEPEIFENTIKYNITLGLPFSETEIAEACDAAHFTEVIKNLQNGLDSEIKEKGVNLSGGQKQRLALARGMLAAKSSHIVCLDEPTSSVDPRTEIQIYNKMFEAFSDKAVISSLHRLHLLSSFDFVYIMDKGKIIDQGTFQYLRNHSAIFNELWHHQDVKAIAMAS
jgi:ABC-type multidrug transport system fused ATPase/permease subunit